MSRANLVSVREFRSNMTRYLQEAQEEGKSIVIMRHAQPVARIVPFEEGTVLEDLVKELPRAKKVKGKKHAPKAKKRSGLRRMFGL
ncbi:MAG: type II toxin-antitoxin system Phd/YefM family antitoxin [Candidatus Peribacteraceae bacterium]